MMTDQEHSHTYHMIVDAIKHPQINFIGMQPENPEEKAEAQRNVLHSFVNHHYLEHDLTEAEANDLHTYIDENNHV